jgi:hypothetical protein
MTLLANLPVTILLIDLVHLLFPFVVVLFQEDVSRRFTCTDRIAVQDKTGKGCQSYWTISIWCGQAESRK